MKEVNQLIPAAIQAVKTHLLANQKVASEFNGYIASFGAALRTCGLQATVVMFSRSDRSSQDKKKLLSAIDELLVSSGFVFPPEKETLMKCIGDRTVNTYLLRLKVEQAAIALKLAIRTFPQTNDKA